MKGAFRPKLDALVNFDYPSIEPRLLAFYLDSIGWPEMAVHFRNGADLYIETAAKVFGISKEEVTPAQRQKCKIVYLSITYGGGIATLIDQEVVEDAKGALDLLRPFHATWPGIGWQKRGQKPPIDTLVWYLNNRMEERGYIHTLWGRHLHPQKLNTLINSLMQGCAADLLKWALVQLDEKLKENDLQSHLVLPVHDSAMLDCPADEVDFICRNVPDWMVYDAVDKIVPFRPEPEVSYETWADLQPWEAN